MDYVEGRNFGVEEVTIADLRYDFFLLRKSAANGPSTVSGPGDMTKGRHLPPVR